MPRNEVDWACAKGRTEGVMVTGGVIIGQAGQTLFLLYHI
jgi:hypothetical protein